MKKVSREIPPRRFSSDADRQRVFEQTAAPRRKQEIDDGDWVDLYELLEVAPDTSTRELDEAIIERGADVVYFTFSRAGKPPRVQLLEKYLHDMRPILLDAPTRRRYDEQLAQHKNHDARAMSYQAFKSTLDIREQSGSCLSSLVFLLGAPFVLWALGKVILVR